MISYIKTEKTSRVVIEGKINPELKQIWLVAHGYGHLAPYFVNKFKTLIDNPEHIIIVPEAMHRYYLNGHSGKVGASWMTKEERETDIEDYCSYLDKVYEKYILPAGKNCIVNALGFSQGGATICRWASRTQFHIDNLIVWGSVIPPDMNWESYLDRLKTLNWFYIAGDKDEFLNGIQQKEQLGVLEKHQIKPEFIAYQGGHDINEATLNLLTKKCVKKD